MDVVYWEQGCRSTNLKTVLTVGNFDGVHLGHREIFGSVVEKARRLGAVPAVLTFDPHPQHFFPRGAPPLITTFEQKAELIADCGIEVVFVAGRTRDFYDMSAEKFVGEVLVAGFGMKYIFVGHDFTFGRGKTGNIELLTRLGETYGFGVEEISAVIIDGMLVSSTMIRNLIQTGNIKEAAKLLGREYSVTGPVVRGVGRGKGLGFPTANVEYAGRLLPPGGVYVVWASVDGRRFFGVANLGTNPTFDARKFSLEVFILDFKGDLYGETIEVGFIDRIRDEIKFSGPEELTRQIRDDITRARGIIADHENRL